ncbi:fumarate hydratase [Cytobacillus sp. FSL W7-1323]|uniref:Fumarate hydratase n=1 Tax=Cytobacillus kochii TaxID=859143 RepID=A0A248TNN8_9BACI|nr:fumarate hydratase [Cytobacillus kochii]ASV69807.1 fumarate hydratase [Cytobacillus kochii]MDQ0184597.1 fumarate hydratase subunit alpha [Cytobacillus kochii]
MKVIAYDHIVEQVAKLCQEANFALGEDVISAFRQAVETERSPIGKDILLDLIENANIATENRVPMCQDTGVSVFIVELGQDCLIKGGTITSAINEGVMKGYKDGYLRHSIVNNPLTRDKSATYNSPAIIHIEMKAGDQLVIHMSAKGGGSENMSALKMLTPADGIEGVKEFILTTVENAGPNACPPLVVGIGIGGNFERCAYLAKKSLFRPIGQHHQSPIVAQLEKDLMKNINEMGIGPQGLGGDTTAIDVKIELEPCHIAALPVAVNLNCHASRHKELRM